MASTGEEIPLPQKGMPISAARDAEVTRVVNSMRHVTGDGKFILMDRKNGTLMSRWIGPTSFGDTAQRYRVKSVGNDYLVCHTWDGTTEGSDAVNIAKPWELQRTPFHGLTVAGVTYSYHAENARKAAHATYDVEEAVDAVYAVNDEILAMTPDGGTGVMTTDITPVAVTLEDINVGARRWERRGFLLVPCDGDDTLQATGNLLVYVGNVIRLEDDTTCYTVQSAAAGVLIGGALVVVSSAASSCAACSGTCHLLTRCTPDTSETKRVHGTGWADHVGGIVTHAGKCWTIGAASTCNGTETEANVGTIQADCTACKNQCWNITLCSGGGATTTRGAYETGQSICIGGVCYLVGATRVCVAETLAALPTFTGCTQCAEQCYTLTSCDTGALDVIYRKGTAWTTAYAAGSHFYKTGGRCYTISATANYACACSVAPTTPAAADLYATCETCQTATTCTGGCVGKTFISATATHAVLATAQANALSALNTAIAAVCTTRGINRGCTAEVHSGPSGGVYTSTQSTCYACCCPEGSTIETVVTEWTADAACVDDEIEITLTPAATKSVCSPACSG